jgi:hypothetical protein
MLAPEPEALGAAEPKSAVLPVTPPQSPAPETKEGGWKDVLDLQGTASGW